MFVTLRILHIVTGVFWAGAVFFMISFLMPSFRAIGSDGAKMFGELRRRRMFTWVPIIATVSVVTGFWMYGIRMGGGGGWAASMEARILGIGAVAGLIALILGFAVMRPASLRADDLSREAGPMPAGAEKDAKMAEAMKLRVRAMMAGRTVATLLLVTVVAMATARYTM